MFLLLFEATVMGPACPWRGACAGRQNGSAEAFHWSLGTRGQGRVLELLSVIVISIF